MTRIFQYLTELRYAHGRWIKAVLLAFISAGTCAAQNGQTQRVETSIEPRIHEVHAPITNSIILSGKSIPATQQGSVNAWPTLPVGDYAVNPNVRIPSRYRLLSPPHPRGMRPIPSEAFSTVSELATSKIQCVGFLMDVYEVSRALWNDITLRGRTCGYLDLQVVATNRENLSLAFHPVVDISWYDCIKWCNARSETDGLVPVYYSDISQSSVFRTGIVQADVVSVDGRANGYRLPTSLEWEAACRGGCRGSFYPWGNDFLSGDKANYWTSGDPFDNGTTPVGYYDGRQIIARNEEHVRDMANRYGLYDMAGNVAEWCVDIAKNAVGLRPPVSETATSAQRVVRGGSWRSRDESLLLCGYEGHAPPLTKADNLGFRTVRAR